MRQLASVFLCIHQKKLLIYGIPAVLCCIIAALVTGLALHEGVLYAIFWGVLFGGSGATVSRLIYHLYLRDYAPEMAYKYYPARWDKDRLMALLAMGKLIQSDFDKITGVELAASIQAQADKNI